MPPGEAPRHHTYAAGTRLPIAAAVSQVPVLADGHIPPTRPNRPAKQTFWPRPLALILKQIFHIYSTFKIDLPSLVFRRDKFMKSIPLFYTIPLLLLLAGCATIVSGPCQVVRVSSNPPDAMVTVDGIERGATPTPICLSRDRDHVVAIDLPGYKHYEISVTRTVNGWFFGNLVIGGAVGMIIDAVDGSIYSLDPDSIDVVLEPLGTRRRYYGGSTTPERLVIALASRPRKAGWTKIGQLERS
jgi:PEGA domain